MTRYTQAMKGMVLAVAVTLCGVGAMAPSAAAAAGSPASATPMETCQTQTIEVCDYWFGIPVHCRTETVTVCISP